MHYVSFNGVNMKTILIIVIVFQLVLQNEGAPRVKTSLGELRGKVKTSFSGTNFSAFEGIPYAKPPIGNRRFEVPEPIDPWIGVLDATATTTCAQTEMVHVEILDGEEDCLHINVYVPGENPKTDSNLDVIVHIHGGAFLYLSAQSYANPDYIVEQNFIFVTFNYRLGVFGFLSTEDDVIPGNNGMKDQVLALQWIQNNIGSFGGNPNSVTLTGLSAGGASVHLHYFSKMSEGLFHRGYSQSGVALNSFVLQEDALKKAKILAQAVGCPTKKSEVLKSCLKQRPYRTLLKQMNLFFDYLFLPFSPFAPVIEKTPNSFLSDYPYNLLAKGKVLDVPWMVSNTIHEGLFPALFLNDDLNTINKRWESLIAYLLDFKYTLPQNEWKSAATKIRQHYLGKYDIKSAKFLDVVKIFSDRIFVTDAEKAVLFQAGANTAPVFYYYFGYPGDENPNNYVMHGADGKYIFGNIVGGLAMSDNEIKMKDIIITNLASFARTGLPFIEGVAWKPTENDALTFLNITGFDIEDMKLQTIAEISPKEFWKSLNIIENENLVKVKDEL